MQEKASEIDKSSTKGRSASGAQGNGGLAGLRIAGVIRDLKRKEGSYLALEESIRRFTEKAAARSPNQKEGAPCAIDRRKLKKIVENDPKLVLSIAELRGIDQYLEHLGHSLAVHPLFEKPELLREIAESRHAVFLLGSKPDLSDHIRINISHWDVLALSSIQTGLQAYEKNLLLDIRETMAHEDVMDARNNLAESESHELFGKRGPSLVCIGSSVGNQMFERTFCAMTNTEAWTESHGDDRFDLPFHFVWPERPYALASRFHLNGEDAASENEDAGRAVKEEGAACFRYQGDYLIDELTMGKREGNTYALCAAQRREDGQIWLVVAGLTGPATCAAARWVNNMPTRFDEKTIPGHPSPVAWNLVRTHATLAASSTGRAYRVGDVEVVAAGLDWGPAPAAPHGSQSDTDA